MSSLPLLPLTCTLSFAPSDAVVPRTGASSQDTTWVSVPLMSSTTMVSAPPAGMTSNRSRSPVSIRMAATSRVRIVRPPSGDTWMRSLAPDAVHAQEVRARSAFDDVAAVAGHCHVNVSRPSAKNAKSSPSAAR